MKTVKCYRYTFDADLRFWDYGHPEYMMSERHNDCMTEFETIGDVICSDFLQFRGFIPSEDWDNYGSEGGQRLLYWESDEDANNDPGVRAAGQVTRIRIEC